MLKKKSLIIFIVIVLASVGLLFWSQQLKSVNNNFAQITGQEQQIINLQFTFSDDNILTLQHDYSPTLSSSLLTITQSIASGKNWAFDAKDYGEMGALVTQIGDYKNGQAQKYWQFYVNGEQPMLSADKFVPKVGDQIEWRFAESKF